MENAAACGADVQQNGQPLMESAAPTSLYATHPPPYLYSDAHYALFYPQPQIPNPNIDYQQQYHTNDPNSVVHPPGVDPNSSFSASPYANAASLHDAHQLAYYYGYPPAVASGPACNPAYYHDPNTAPLAFNPYSNGLAIQPPVAEKSVRAKPNSALRVKRAIGLRKTDSLIKRPKKAKVVQSAWCEVCKVDCNSADVLDKHKLGKKHKKNSDKLIAASTQVTAPVSTPAPAPVQVQVLAPASASAPAPAPATASASASASASVSVPTDASAASDNTVIGPQENPAKVTGKKRKRKKKPSSTTNEDLETKKEKMLKEGATAGAVRLCDICNVVCNSETVFKYHLAGQRHVGAMKKHASETKIAATSTVTNAETSTVTNAETCTTTSDTTT